MSEPTPYTTPENNNTNGAAQINVRMIVAEMRSIGRAFATFVK
jgi:hypothetical protein